MMMIAKNDEEKRSRLWRNVLTAASILLVVVIVFFLIEGFFGNPLEGKWKHDESDMTLTVSGDDTAELSWNQLFEGKELKLKLQLTLKKAEKQVVFYAEEEELRKAAEAVGDDVTAADVKSAVSSMLTSFNYSVDGTELTLTEWDYGDQIFFNRIK